MADIASQLRIPLGITSIIGSGGKTTLMMTLARELSRKGTVIITTSTKILPPENIPILSDVQALQGNPSPIWCVAASHPSGKLTAPQCPFSRLAELADYVLVEADGSRGLPLKAHAPHEPVIPEGSGQVICVVGADGFYKPLNAVCHRPEIFAQLTGTELHAVVTPGMAAEVIRKEGLAHRILLNKVESPRDWEAAYGFAAAASLPVLAGSLQKGVLQCL